MMLPARFWAKVNKTPACWIWTATRQAGGYGYFSLNGRLQRAHRLAYEDAVGAIPLGMQLDHLCKTPSCVNPAHLEPVTPKENTLRGVGSKTHCKHGHPLMPPNVYWAPKGHRECHTCRRMRRVRVAR